MYKNLTRNNWHKLLQFPTEKTVDAVIVSGNSLANRDRELNLLKKALLKFPKVKHITNIQDRFFSTVYEFEIENKLIWFDVTYGGTYLSELLHIGCILGSQKNFLIGSCGGLQKYLEIGDLIIPTYTYGNESTTRIYQPNIKDNKHYPDEKLKKAITNNLINHPLYSGPIMTCQAMLGETEEDINQWSREGYLGVEMETSTLFAVSNSFNVPSIAILQVSDNLVKNILYGNKALEEKRDFRNNLKIFKLEKIINNIVSE